MCNCQSNTCAMERCIFPFPLPVVKILLWANSLRVNCPQICTRGQHCVDEKSKVRLGSSIDWNGLEFSPHAQVLSNDSHQCHAGDVDEPPGQSSWEMSVIDPAADHMEEVHSYSEVQALFATTDEEPQTKSTVNNETEKLRSALLFSR